jgi:hypothetical protein
VLKAQETISATGHKAVTDVAVLPTCTETGKTEGSHCETCGEVLKAQETISATGHKAVTDVAVLPTCTETGKTEGSHCETCGEVLKAQETVPATGHSYDAGKETIAPTYTTKGELTYTCTACGASRKEEIETIVENITIYNGIDYSAVYNADYYYKNNADLSEAFGKDSEALLKHFVEYGMKEGRQANESFSVSSYKEGYLDLQEAFGDNLLAYYEHYMQFGQSENRKAVGELYNGTDYSAVFDCDYYYEHNADVAEAFGKDHDALLKHFVEYGMKEGRQGNAEFNVNVYKAMNGDVSETFADDTEAYYQHYMAYGVNENRITASNAFCNGMDYSAVYDKDYYLSSNADLQAAFGDNAEALIKHFVEYGMKEGRQANAAFNVLAYKEKYGDLREAFGDDIAAYYVHYITYGKAEGR